MSNILIASLMIADVFVALLIIGLVLVQQSKGGLGTSFGGGGSDSLFGAHASSHLSKLTVIFSSIFFAITLALTVIVARRVPEAHFEDEADKIVDSSGGAAAQAAPSGSSGRTMQQQYKFNAETGQMEPVGPMTPVEEPAAK